MLVDKKFLEEGTRTSAPDFEMSLQLIGRLDIKYQIANPPTVRLTITLRSSSLVWDTCSRFKSSRTDVHIWDYQPVINILYWSEIFKVTYN